MHGFLTSSAKVRPLFGRAVRIPLQNFIEIIYKVSVGIPVYLRTYFLPGGAGVNTVTLPKRMN